MWALYSAKLSDTALTPQTPGMWWWIQGMHTTASCLLALKAQIYSPSLHWASVLSPNVAITQDKHEEVTATGEGPWKLQGPWWHMGSSLGSECQTTLKQDTCPWNNTIPESHTGPHLWGSLCMAFSLVRHPLLYLLSSFIYVDFRKESWVTGFLTVILS